MIIKIIKWLSPISKPFAKFLLSFFFDKKYLQGRHFDESYLGYLWAMHSVWEKNILRLGKPFPWPTCLTCRISNKDNIFFDINDINIFQSPGVYFQNFNGRITLGRGVYIAPNVGLITSNHILEDLDRHSKGEDITIGPASWIGMNAIVLPGVILGERTIVAAGSVVTKSYPGGNIVLAGVPAKIIKYLKAEI